MPTVATITPVLNDALGLPNAVASISAQVGAEIDLIVLAVGPSSDGSREVAEELAAGDARIVIVENPSGRTPDALNRAIAVATRDIIVRVDARAVLPETYVRDAVETLLSSGAGNVGAAQDPVGVSRTERAIAAAMRSRLGSGGVAYRGHGVARKVDTAWLGVFRRSALEDVGGYDEAFIRNQDAELNARLNAAGHEVWFDPRLRVEYRPRGSFAKLARQYGQYGWWRQRTARKHPETLRLRQLAAPGIVIGVATGAGLGAIASPWFLLMPGGYILAVLGAGLSSHGPVQQRLLTSAALATMHLSWGSGFLLSAARSIVA